MKTIQMLMIILLVFLLQIPFLALAEEDEDLALFGLEAEKLLALGSGILAAVLCALTFLAYTRTKRERLIFIAVAFLLFFIKSFLFSTELFFEEFSLVDSLFSIKSFLISTELFMEELSWIDPLSAFLDFAILLIFFYGVLKR